MTHVLRIAHLRIALHVANPEVGNREGIHDGDLHDDLSDDGSDDNQGVDDDDEKGLFGSPSES